MKEQTLRYRYGFAPLHSRSRWPLGSAEQRISDWLLPSLSRIFAPVGRKNIAYAGTLLVVSYWLKFSTVIVKPQIAVFVV